MDKIHSLEKNIYTFNLFPLVLMAPKFSNAEGNDVESQKTVSPNCQLLLEHKNRKHCYIDRNTQTVSAGQFSKSIFFIGRGQNKRYGHLEPSKRKESPPKCYTEECFFK